MGAEHGLDKGLSVAGAFFEAAAGFVEQLVEDGEEGLAEVDLEGFGEELVVAVKVATFGNESFANDGGFFELAA